MKVNGFTIIELVIVIALTAIIASLVYQFLPRAQVIFVDRMALEYLENDSILQLRNSIYDMSHPFERDLFSADDAASYDTLWIQRPTKYGLREIQPIRTYNSISVWK